MTEFRPNIHPWNETIWQQLAQDSKRRNHALLFSGHSGLGKIDLGFALLYHVVSQTGSQSARLFAAGSHPDVHVLMPEERCLERPEDDLLAQYARRYLETHGGKPKRAIVIEQVRELNQAIATHPHIAANRLVFILYSQALNRNAANALLKSLEEPPANTLFVLVSDDASSLPKTIRSRCSVVEFHPPSAAMAARWVEQHTDMPAHEIASHLAMANFQPLKALALFESGYVDSLKVVFNDVNGLWNRKRNPIESAKNWQQCGTLRVIEILQKLCADLVRSQFSDQSVRAFFPVQQSWVASICQKLSQPALFKMIDTLNEARRLQSSNVDELLVLETIALQISRLPKPA